MGKRKKIEWDLKSEREIWSALCSPNRWFEEDGSVGTHPDALWWFLHLAWGSEFYFRSGNLRWCSERMHKPYLRWLQNHILEWKVSRRKGLLGRKYLMIMLPRDTGKTVTATKAASLWCHLDDPDLSITIAAGTGAFAAAQLKVIKQVMAGKDQSAWFQWLFGIWENPERAWRKDFVEHGYRENTVIAEPSYDIAGVDIGMTGYHPQVVIWDDPIIGNKLREGGTHMDNVHAAFDSTDPALKKDGLWILVCTRYLDDDVAGRNLSRLGGIQSWTGHSCPNIALYEKYEEGTGYWNVFYYKGYDEINDTSFIPEVYSTETLRHWKDTKPDDFASQVQNDPGTGELAPITEDQIRDCFVDYKELRMNVPVGGAIICLDTAFKSRENVKKGDDSVIFVYLQDLRPNGILWVHTDDLKVSNEWRSEDFTDELVKSVRSLRKAGYPILKITDEKEVGGKEGMFKDQLVALLRGAGTPIPPNNFIQLNRQGKNKRSRIRKAASYWANGFVRILLHKNEKGEWIIPPVVRKMINQMARIDVTPKDDIADAAADGYAPGVWRKPSFESHTNARDEGMSVRQMGDEGLKTMSRALTDDELRAMMDGEMERRFAGGVGPGRGFDDFIRGDRYGG